jgi:hypothetical protein
MFKAVELPTGVSHLDSSLTNVNRKAFPHFDEVIVEIFKNILE